jgi:hypothetical protein
MKRRITGRLPETRAVTRLYIRKIFIFILTISLCIPADADDIYRNYVEVLGEGPVGGRFIGFETKYYTLEEGVEFARTEILNFVSGMIFGYDFVYKVENPLNKSEGYFDMTPVSSIRKDDKNLKVIQLEESQTSIRVQGQYRLNEDQKTYIRGFGASKAFMSMGEAYETWVGPWDKRIDTVKDAVRNAVLNGARKNLKSRPLYIKGKLVFSESPHLYVVSGQWRAVVKINLVISEVQYMDTY